MSHFVITASVASLNEHIKICFLKEIGISNQFVLRKSLEIDKIEMMLAKRHLAIFSNYLLTLIELYWTFVYVEWIALLFPFFSKLSVKVFFSMDLWVEKWSEFRAVVHR